jgi:hypothetical protein
MTTTSNLRKTSLKSNDQLYQEIFQAKFDKSNLIPKMNKKVSSNKTDKTRKDERKSVVYKEAIIEDFSSENSDAGKEKSEQNEN